MALIQVNFLSQALMRTVPINVILPADKMTFPGMPQAEPKPYKTLYLLHGVFGNYTDWVSGTRIQRWAEENDLCVVMPSGDNAFYEDNPGAGNFYGKFIGEELVNITRKMFNLSHKREDTFIAGLSMGGFGSLRNGLKYHQTFGAICALSSALVLDDAPNSTYDTPFFLSNRSYFEHCFGRDLETAVTDDRNPTALVPMLAKEGVQFPRIYMACGVDDGLLGANRAFSQLLTDNGVEHTYEEGPGAHEWDFWDTYIKKAIDWLDLKPTGLGINSGNVGVV